jgi:hypothetical protein
MLRRCFRSFGAFLVVSADFNLNPHTWQAEALHSNGSQNRLVVGEPLLEVANRGRVPFLAELDEVEPDLVHLAPAFAACVLEAVIDVSKGLIDFFAEVCWDLAGLWVPAACGGD